MASEGVAMMNKTSKSMVTVFCVQNSQVFLKTENFSLLLVSVHLELLRITVHSISYHCYRDKQHINKVSVLMTNLLHSVNLY